MRCPDDAETTSGQPWTQTVTKELSEHLSGDPAAGPPGR